MTDEQIEVLRLARSLIRDLVFDWPIEHLAETPEAVCQKLTAMIGDSFDYASGDVIEGTSPKENP